MCPCTSMQLTLQDVAIAATALAGAGGDAGIQTTSLELLSQQGIELALAHALLQLALDVVRCLQKGQQTMPSATILIDNKKPRRSTMPTFLSSILGASSLPLLPSSMP